MDVAVGHDASSGAGQHVLRGCKPPELPVTEIQLQRDEHADSVVDLLGMVAYGRLSGFFRLTDDAAIAASLPDKIALAEMAVAEYDHFRQVLRRLEEKGYTTHTVDGRTYVYQAAEPRARVAAKAVQRVVDWFCNGSIEEVLVGMVDTAMLDQKQVQMLADKIAKSKSRGAKK